MGRYFPVPKLIFTLALLLALHMLQWVKLPFVQLPNVAGNTYLPPTLSVVALGASPFLAGFLIVEFLAWIFRRERNTSRSRTRISWVAFSLGGLVALGQSIYQVRSWAHLSSGEAVATGATMFFGALLFLVAALLISRFGLGNGFAAILFAAALGSEANQLRLLYQRILVDVGTKTDLLLAVATLVISVICVWFFTRKKSSNVAAGVIPLIVGLSLLNALEVPAGTYTHKGIYILVSVAAVVPLALLFRPRIYKGAAFDWKTTLLFVAILASLSFLEVSDEKMPIGVSVFTLALATAAVLDMMREGYFLKRFDSAIIWSFANLYHAQALRERLAEKEIPAFVRGAHFRAMQHIFGPEVPLEIFVPNEHVDAAKQIALDYHHEKLSKS